MIQIEIKNELNKRLSSIISSGTSIVRRVRRSRPTIRLTALLLLAALLAPIVFFDQALTVAAAAQSAALVNHTIAPAPVAAPPEAFAAAAPSAASSFVPVFNGLAAPLIAAGNKIAAGYESAANVVAPPALPDGFGNAVLPSFRERAADALAALLAPSAVKKAVEPPTAESNAAPDTASNAKSNTASTDGANDAPTAESPDPRHAAESDASFAPPAAPPLPLAPATTRFDFDGDGKADVARFQSSSNQWTVKSSGGGAATTSTLGTNGSIIAPADYDGDGKTDRAVWNQYSADWTIKNSSNGATQTISGFGLNGDVPISGDYDNDGVADAALFRPSSGTWYVRSSSGGQFTSTTFGQSGDIPVPGNYDGTGGLDFAVFRPSNGTWYIKVPGNGGTYTYFQWGASGDVPVAADYNGDGQTDYAVYRPANGTWYVQPSGGGSYISKTWGNYGDQPVPADYDGDGTADISVWRPTSGVWYLVKSTDATLNTYAYDQLGIPGDAAVPAAYVKQIGGAVAPSNLANARLHPRNATGGTDLYSQNFSWGSGLVNLPGRAELDAGFGISYNSLVWTKEPVSNTMVFDADHSNVAPGFRFGFPVIEPSYYNGLTQQFSYLMVTPAGGRVEFRQNAASGVYETADSSYAQLTVVVPPGFNGPRQPTAGAEDLTLLVRTTDGTQMTYLWRAGSYRLAEIKDRNGNFITVVHDTQYGLLQSMTDTLGRVVTVEYDSDFAPVAVKQDWKDNNGAGPGIVSHTYATFTYTAKQITPNFGSLNVFGPSNGAYVKVLDQIIYPTGARTAFDYNAYGQVYKVRNIAADLHELNSVRTDLQTPATNQTDCPRFATTYNKVENFNNNAETVIHNTFAANVTYTGGGESLGATDVTEVWLDGDPHAVHSKTWYHTAGSWNEGLPLGTEDIAGGVRKRWTRTVWTQDDPAKIYRVNPRVIESRVADDSNIKKTTTDYFLQSNTNISIYGLASEVKLYDGAAGTLLKRATSTYNLTPIYLARRIIGLSAESDLYDGSGTLLAKTTFGYDEGDFTGTEQNIAAVTQHDNTGYGANFIAGRGNATSATRHDVLGQTNPIMSSVKYNTAGAAVAQITPGSTPGTTRQIKISYADVFNDSGNSRNTYAYPTKITDPADNFSLVKYRFDIGANIWAKSPAPANNSTGKETTREYDSLGRLLKETLVNNGAYTRYDYTPSDREVHSKVYSTLIDTTGDGANAADEVLTESWTDGAGRVRQSRTALPGSSSGLSGTLVEYDILGQVKRQTVPTEINAVGQPAGEDIRLDANGDVTFLWTAREYDWKGRVTREINTDGTDRLTSYEGCGCAGGQITTVQSESVPVPNQNYSARRIQKLYADVQGRAYKSEVLNWDNSVYTTDVTQFDGRDQAVSAKQYVGAAGSSVFQETTFEYDGFGRLKKQHRPEQINSDTTSGYTTYNYNGDDSIESVVDARGARTSYTYDGRGLTTQISSGVPTGSTVPIAPTIIFGYDALGNRTSMTDGLGTMAYEYDDLSRMKSETRFFSDFSSTPSNGYKLEYTYQLGGQLKSYKDPFGKQINYALDKIGRLSAVTGTSASGTVNYASNATYRAWGALAHLDYGNGTQINVGGFNDKLQATTFELKSGATQLISKSYEFYADGAIKKENDALNHKFDRSYEYDQMARMVEARSGAEARGETDNPINIPFINSYQYDVFGHQTRDTFGHFSRRSGDVTTEYQNNRFTYANGNDAEGNIITDAKYWTYDTNNKPYNSYHLFYPDPAAGVTDQEFFYYDGNGLLSKIKTSHQINDDEPEVHSTYKIRSTMLGGEAVSEIGGDVQTYIRANGTVVATNDGGQDIWMHKDLNLNSLRSTSANGTVVGSGLDQGNTDIYELDPAGKSIGFSDPYAYGIPDPEIGLFDPGQSFSSIVNGVPTTYAVDGVSVPKAAFDRMTEFAFGGIFGFIEQQARRSQGILLGRTYGYQDREGRVYGNLTRDEAFQHQREGHGQVNIANWHLVNDSWAVNLSLFAPQTQTNPFTEVSLTEENKKTLENNLAEATSDKNCSNFINGILKKLKSTGRAGYDTTDINQLFKLIFGNSNNTFFSVNYQEMYQKGVVNSAPYARTNFSNATKPDKTTTMRFDSYVFGFTQGTIGNRPYPYSESLATAVLIHELIHAFGKTNYFDHFDQAGAAFAVAFEIGPKVFSPPPSEKDFIDPVTNKLRAGAFDLANSNYFTNLISQFCGRKK